MKESYYHEKWFKKSKSVHKLKQLLKKNSTPVEVTVCINSITRVTKYLVNKPLKYCVTFDLMIC